MMLFMASFLVNLGIPEGTQTLWHLFQDLSSLCGNKCDSNMDYKAKSFPWPSVYFLTFYFSCLISTTRLASVVEVWTASVGGASAAEMLNAPLLRPVPSELVLMRSRKWCYISEHHFSCLERWMF